jgi:hypothetical protein
MPVGSHICRYSINKRFFSVGAIYIASLLRFYLNQISVSNNDKRRIKGKKSPIAHTMKRFFLMWLSLLISFSQVTDLPSMEGKVLERGPLENQGVSQT